MVKNNEKTPAEEKVIKPKATSKTTKTKPSPQNYLIWLPALIALIAIGIAIYTVSLNQQLSRDFVEQKEQMNSRLSDFQQTLDSAGKALKQTKQELQTINQHVKSTMQQQSYGHQDWMLLKARYYLELAQINAHWSDNINVAIALLQQADDLLAHLKNKQLFTIRQAIAQDIATLRAIPAIDVAGLLSQLDAAQNLVSQLPLAITGITPDQTIQTKQQESHPKSWWQRLQDSINSLEKLVVIRHHEEDIKPLLSPVYANLLRDVIRFNLQGAQWAILKRDNESFQFALTQAIHHIKNNFDTQKTITQSLIDQLTKLKQINLSKERPKLGQSLSLLNELINKPENVEKTAPSKKGESSQ